MDNIPGMQDRYGVELRRRRHLISSFTSIAESFGYEPLAVSLLEQAAAYSEDIVGESPWPEWDRRSCFFIPLEDYTSNYHEQPQIQQAILIPEGTVSVTRWLGNQLTGADKANVASMGIKVYYDSPCFRNEPIDTLWAGKSRSFTQFGVEFLGAGDAAADLEPLVLAYEALKSLGVPSTSVIVRLSSNRIFMQLADASGLSSHARVLVKEALDTIAECKAGKRPERYTGAYADLQQVLVDSTVTAELSARWSYLATRPTGAVSNEDYEMLSVVQREDIAYLDDLSKVLQNGGMAVEVDLCVVRSHEYYTGFTFEIDVVGQDGVRHVEIGGGGRYDRLLSDFAPEGFPETIPSTGFAFGVERLLAALLSGGYLTASNVQHNTVIDLTDDGIVELVQLSGESALEIGEQYLTQTSILAKRRQSERVSIVAADG